MTDTVVPVRITASSRPDPQPSFAAAELAEVSADLETAPATEVVSWAIEQFHPNLSLTSSMTDAVLIDLAWRIEPSIEVVFIDTGYHFPETLETMERVRRHYGLNLRVLTVPPHDQELWRVDPENCCSAVKVGQMDRALQGKLAWMSGLRRSEASTRAAAPIVSRDVRGLVKINPIAQWTDEDVDGYIDTLDIPLNPLLLQGYTSIGCMPCTSKPVDPNDPRSGRWAGKGKTECGIHDD